ncbi:dTDP-4-dehydrorhamnose 3,5-epimerase [Salinivibrio sp. IB574]|uniref:dTDP-4-dehydrorhamnose 3,5-epimerase n=1 Tax=Salinivibrio sp. IB574 TaxID=1909444 RepID=UPI0009896323|nr:dTDP-4-dehydrorhamnose 3,5-epimerase [Salinivibrio sp. IB574]OOF20389.1 dTDP-4-dehydrorhamnose 3,5-epimerase [Salinivibrio sp. IB574]
MKATPTNIQGVYIIEPKVFGDERGFFFESFNHQKFEEAIKQKVNFVQDNHSRSIQNVVRGLHFQTQQAQGKLVRCTLGEVRDVAVDIRRDSPTFGEVVTVDLSADNKKQLWIPAGLAHGFSVLSEVAEFLYKTTDYYAPQYEACIKWDDPTLNINWKITGEAIVSEKDKQGMSFREL